MVGGENSHSIEREIGNVGQRPSAHSDSEAFSHLGESSSEQNENRFIHAKNEAPNWDRLLISIELLSSEMNTILFQEIDSSMIMMRTQINKAISSAISYRVIPEIRNIMGTLFLGHRDTD